MSKQGGGSSSKGNSLFSAMKGPIRDKCVATAQKGIASDVAKQAIKRTVVAAAENVTVSDVNLTERKITFGLNKKGGR